MNERPVAMYVGTFDPFTNGHLDVITRASQIFNTVIIGIGENQDKRHLFSPQQREQMVIESCQSLKNVQTTVFSGLAIDHALAKKVSVMVRGIRTEADYVYEMQMAMMNRTLCNKIETIFIPTRQSLSHISSSLVKQVASLGGDVSGFVPNPVFKELTDKFKG